MGRPPGRRVEGVPGRVFRTIADIESAIGDDLGATQWFEIDQERITAFAEATLDDYWLHVDVGRATLGPFGRTIAHGFLTLSLVPFFERQLMTIDIAGGRLNYGLEKVRFPAPVLVGARLRGRTHILGIPRVEAGHQLRLRHTLEIEHQRKPACVAETILILLD